MTSGESSLRMPKEATCDVECAMKVEEIRILSKKRKQSQRVVGGSNGAVTSKGPASNGKAAKRPLPNGSSSSSCGAGLPSSAKASGSSSSNSSSSSAQQLGGAASAPSLSKTPSMGGGGNSKDAKDAAAARRRFVWSVPLHQDFVAAVFDVGLKCASPKLLLEMMPVVDGLTSEHIKSHLQKYRLHRQRSREEFLKSYNYLTDLDGGKGLGGGSAAATVAKAAAAAAGSGDGGGGDSKHQFSGSGSTDPEGGCGSSCDCDDSSSKSGGGGGGGSGSGSVSGKGGSGSLVGEDQGRKTFAKSTSRDDTAERSGSSTKARARQADGGAEAGDEAQRLQPLEAAPREAASGSLLLAHLELLAKGIDMQVKFHNHLRDVFDSQQQLHAQLVEQQRNGHLDQLPADRTGSVPRIIPSSTAGEATPSASNFSPPALQQQHAAGGGVRVKDQDQTQKQLNLVVGGGGGGRGGAMAGYRTLAGPGKAGAPAAGNLGWSGAAAGTRTPGVSPGPAERGDRGSAAQTPRRRERSVGLNHAGAMQSDAATDVSVDSARSVSGPRRDAAAVHHHPSLHGGKAGEVGDAQRQQQPQPQPQPQQRHQPQRQPQHHQHQHQHQHQQFNPTAMREAFSVQSVAGGVSLPQGLRSAGQQPSGVGSRGYVPGEYTLTSKAAETGACGGPSHVHGQSAFFGLGEGLLGTHGTAFAASSPAEARAALAAAGLAPPTTTIASGQETLTLQRHMQAQMSMQQSMLSACNDQATNFGQRAWCRGSGITPAFGGGGESTSASVPPSSSRGTDGAEAGRQEGGGDNGGGGGGGGGGGMGDGANAGMGNKEQRLDALALHPPDAGDSSGMMGMGLLHQDDMFDFGMLDREGELKSGDNPASPAAPGRPSGDEHSTLFSFLME